MINIELFSCAGGMAEGFRRAGVHFQFAFDYMEDHCDSYEKNLGYRPIRMDVRDLLRMIENGWRAEIDLFVADPPCTPWSRAGKREGIEDERDMLQDTCKLIELLRPRRYVIGNVPGLDDMPNWHIVQRVIGGLAQFGYCVADFAALDAANYGVPQHRVRPFWFGHQRGDCIRWPAPSHGDPAELRLAAGALPGITPLIPWVTCRQALGHLSAAELGRPVKLRRQRKQHSPQHGSIKDRPARVVGTSNLSDGNVLLDDERDVVNPHAERGSITAFDDHHKPSQSDEPARAITRNTHGDGTVLVLNDRHAPAELDAPAPTLGAKYRGQSAQVLVDDPKHPLHHADQPANTLRASDGEGANRTLVLDGAAAPRRKRDPSSRGQQSTRVYPADRPSPVVTAKEDRQGAGTRIDFTLSSEAAAKPGKGGSPQGPQGMRVHDPDAPSPTVTQSSRDRDQSGHMLAWPWERPSTAVAADDRIAPPGHKDESWSGGTRSMPGAVVLSEKAAAILQGFPETWVFSGDSKKARWSQIGQAMPPPLAHAVATSVVAQDLTADVEARRERAELEETTVDAKPKRKRAAGR